MAAACSGREEVSAGRGECRSWERAALKLAAVAFDGRPDDRVVLAVLRAESF